MASEALEGWKSGSKWWRTFLDAKPRAEIIARLEALGPNPSPEKVDEAIGCNSWTRLWCHECIKDAECVIRVGDDEHPHDICPACVFEMLRLIDGE